MTRNFNLPPGCRISDIDPPQTCAECWAPASEVDEHELCEDCARKAIEQQEAEQWETIEAKAKLEELRARMAAALTLVLVNQTEEAKRKLLKGIGL